MFCATILVVDDEPLVRMALRARLERAGHQVLEAGDGALALARLSSGVDLVLLDYHLPDTRGLELLARIRAELPDVPVIILTASNSVTVAVEAMRAGAFHYATKPFDRDEVTLLIDRALETSRLRGQLRLLRAHEARGVDQLIGESPQSLALKRLLAKIARSPASTVLITGESGTGKGLVARALHEVSERHDAPFVSITCSALPHHLVESELFGHERGAFTDAHERKQGLFEAAEGGTLFLDEIGELAPQLQAKLLGFLEERTFRRVGGNVDIRSNVRIVAATNAELSAAVENKTFREDLYYRLAVMLVPLQPLREREGDAELLALHYISRFNDEFNKRIVDMSAAARRKIAGYRWPGNVRELRNAVERAVLLADDTVLAAHDFPLLPDVSDAQPEATTHASVIPLLASERHEPSAVGGDTAEAKTEGTTGPASCDAAARVGSEPVLPNAALDALFFAEGFLALPWREVRQGVLERAERAYLDALLRTTRGRVGETAARAGIQSRSLFDKMRALGLRKEDYR